MINTQTKKCSACNDGCVKCNWTGIVIVAGSLV